MVNKYLGEKIFDVYDRMLNFKKSIKNLPNIDNKINMIIDDYQPKSETKYDNKKELLAFYMK